MKKLLFILGILLVFAGCENEKKPTQTTTQKQEKKNVVVPAFVGD